MTIFSPGKRLTSLVATLVTLAILLTLETPLILPASASNKDTVMAGTHAGLDSRLDPSPRKADERVQSKARQAYGQLPLAFEANRGQMDSRVKFLSRANGYALFLTADEAVMTLRVADSGSRNAGSQKAVHRPPASQSAIINSPLASLRMKFTGASRKARIIGVDEMAAKSNYLIGNDPAKWRTDVPAYSKVKYEGVYPGIDLVFYGNQRELEYDFIVAPGADFRAINIRFEGARRIRFDANGDLLIDTAAGEVRQRRPVVYQEIKGARRAIAGRYKLCGKSKVGFEVGAYDRSKPLVIDPVLTYSTYLGGSAGDEGLGIAVDASGSAYVVGRTISTDFPKTSGALQQTHNGNLFDVFVSKFFETGTGLVYSTYLGGTDGAIFEGQGDQGFGIAVDSAGNAYVVGQTSSPDFPTTATAPQRMLAGGTDAFIAKINPVGNALVYSTYLGGSSTTNGFVPGDDVALAVALDGARNAYVTGRTNSIDFPTVSALQPMLGGSGQFVGSDAFIAKLNPAGTAFVFSTYFGGNGPDIGAGIAIDSASNIYVAGLTGSGNLKTTESAFQRASNGGIVEGFVAKLDQMASTTIYLTYLGGSDEDTISSIAVDSAGNAYVAGTTRSVDFPAVNPLQGVNNSGPAFRSTNGGASWSVLHGGLTARAVESLAVDPQMPSTIYAGTENGIFKSTDGGASWTRSSEGLTALSVLSLVVDPQTSTTVYAGTVNGGVFKSTDGGASWVITNLFNGPVISKAINQLVIDPLTPSTLYARGGVVPNPPMGPPFSLELFKSTDAGQTWNALNVPTAFNTDSLAIDPRTPTTLYLGTTVDGLFKSTNGGATWAATELQDIQVHSLLVDPINTANVYAGTFHARRNRDAIYKSTNGGISWERTAGTGVLKVINPATPSTLYSTPATGLLKSTDAGASWRTSDLAGVLIRSLAINPSSPQTLYAGAVVGSDAFVTKLNPTGTALVYSTYLGGKNSDSASAIAINAAGNAFIAGVTSSADFPVRNAFQPGLGNSEMGSDGFVTELSADGSAIVYSTFVGGAGTEGASGIAVDSLGSAYITGFTSSTNFPTVTPVQRQYGGGNLDAFVAKIASPRITSVTIDGKNLIIMGEGFGEGAVILINNLEQKTKNDAASPATVLVGKKAAKAIAPGQRVTIQIRNPNGETSNQISFVRPTE